MVGALLLLFLIIGTFAPADEDSPSGSEATTTTEMARETQPQTTAPEEEPEPEQEPPPEDTGRMSESEYETFTRQIAEVEDEIQQFAAGLGKCGLLLSNAELDAASDCFDESYDGLEDDMLGAFATVDGYEEDVACGCLKALRLYKDRLDSYYGYTKALHESGANLEFQRFSALADQAGPSTRRYRQAAGWASDACAPR